MRIPPLAGLPLSALSAAFALTLTLVLPLTLGPAGPAHAQSGPTLSDAAPAAVDGAIIPAPAAPNGRGKADPTLGAPGVKGPAGPAGVETRYLLPPVTKPATREEACGRAGSSMAAQRAGCAGDARLRESIGRAPVRPTQV